jgi:hypothetical protein
MKQFTIYVTTAYVIKACTKHEALDYVWSADFDPEDADKVANQEDIVASTEMPYVKGLDR